MTFKFVVFIPPPDPTYYVRPSGKKGEIEIESGKWEIPQFELGERKTNHPTRQKKGHLMTSSDKQAKVSRIETVKRQFSRSKRRRNGEESAER